MSVLFPVSMLSHCLTPAYEWEHAVFHFLFLCQFAENDVLQVHPRPNKAHELIIFDGCIIFQGVYTYIHFFLGSFQVFAIVKSATMNLELEIPFDPAIPILGIINSCIFFSFLKEREREKGEREQECCSIAQAGIQSRNRY